MVWHNFVALDTLYATQLNDNFGMVKPPATNTLVRSDGTIYNDVTIVGGTLTTDTLTLDWNAGVVSDLEGASISSGTLTTDWNAGTVTVIEGGTIATGTLTLDWNAGIVTDLDSSLTVASGTIATTLLEYIDITNVGNTADTTEDDLHSHVLAAGKLSANGQSIRVTAAGTFAANAHAKDARLYYGTNLIVDLANADAAVIDWHINILIIRTGTTGFYATGVAVIGDGVAPTNAIAINLAASGTQDTAATIEIKTTGQTDTAVANDVRARILNIEYLA